MKPIVVRLGGNSIFIVRETTMYNKYLKEELANKVHMNSVLQKSKDLVNIYV